MPLYIRHSDNDLRKVVETEWALPQAPPKINPEKVVEIQASGKELDETIKMFNGLLSKSHGQYSLWEGSLAKVVYERVINRLGK